MDVIELAIAVPVIIAGASLGIKGYIGLNGRMTVIEVMLRILLRHNGHTDESLEEAIKGELNNHKNRKHKVIT